jgi:hypothetical protein
VSGEVRVLYWLAAAAPTFVPQFHDSEGNLQVEETLCRLIEHLGEREIFVDELASTMREAEKILARGDPSEARVVDSFLEDVQLFVSYPDTALDANDVLAVLPAGCRARWDKIDAQWRAVGETTLGPDPSMTIERYRAIEQPRLRRLTRGLYRVMPHGRFVGVADILRSEVQFPPY